jgi:hypothetical protein
MWDKFLMTTTLVSGGAMVGLYALLWIRRLANCTNVNDKLMELREEVEESNLYNRKMILERLDEIICLPNKYYLYKVDEYINFKSLRKYM